MILAQTIAVGFGSVGGGLHSSDCVGASRSNHSRQVGSIEALKDGIPACAGMTVGKEP